MRFTGQNLQEEPAAHWDMLKHVAFDEATGL